MENFTLLLIGGIVWFLFFKPSAKPKDDKKGGDKKGGDKKGGEKH